MCLHEDTLLSRAHNLWLTAKSTLWLDTISSDTRLMPLGCAGTQVVRFGVSLPGSLDLAVC
jgi:hypothetical protein